MNPDWSQMEQGALENFINDPGAVRAGLAKFLSSLATEYQKRCAAAMQTVPRNHEIAADNAAKAQVLDEFWIALADALQQQHVGQTSEP
jgi:membrane-bound ClpP family serine protease